jgi:hypothetical protein
MKDQINTIKTEKMVKIEKSLSLTQDQIENALIMIFDKDYAETQKNTAEYKIMCDKNMQDMCFQYSEELVK